MTALPIGIEIPTGSTDELITPATAFHPWTTKPVFGLTNRPSVAMSKEPSWAKTCWAPSLSTKYPSPWSAKSGGLLVDCRLPWDWIVSMPPISIPNPTCAGLIPPVVAVELEGPLTVWLKISLEGHSSHLEPDRIDVGQVIADDVQERLMVPETGNRGKH